MANLCEYVAKPLLAKGGIAVPKGKVAQSPTEVEAIAEEFGSCVIKAQIPIGGRGKAGGIKIATTPSEARITAAAVLGMNIGGYIVDTVLVEERISTKMECYAAIMNDSASKGPLLLFSSSGGVDVEEITGNQPQSMIRQPIDITRGIDDTTFKSTLANQFGETAQHSISNFLKRLYKVYRDCDAELVEINPLAITTENTALALDCKFILDDSAIPRQQKLEQLSTPELQTDLESEAGKLGLKYIQLDGDIGILANGAGLTMTTMDAVVHFGGKPANFLEIGGEAYTKGRQAVELLLRAPGIQSIIVNFCGAFARTDVMAKGVVEAWKDLEPEIPISFSVHGTGDLEAIKLINEGLGIKPYEYMDDAIRAAVQASRVGP